MLDSCQGVFTGGIIVVMTFQLIKGKYVPLVWENTYRTWGSHVSNFHRVTQNGSEICHTSVTHDTTCHQLWQLAVLWHHPIVELSHGGATCQSTGCGGVPCRKYITQPNPITWICQILTHFCVLCGGCPVVLVPMLQPARSCMVMARLFTWLMWRYHHGINNNTRKYLGQSSHGVLWGCFCHTVWVVE